MAEDIDDTPDPLAPRRNPDLIGHGAAEALLAASCRAGRMPHAVILGGLRGIGKATLAYRFARWVLAGGGSGAAEEPAGLFGMAPAASSLHVAPEHPVARRVASGGHGDLLSVERGWDARRKKLRGEIVVEDVREIAQFLHLTAAEGGWRVVVIDSADEMNRNAANALLKILEEPPKQALLLLVCHAPGRLLATIRSRCRRVDLQPLAGDEVAALLARHRPALGAAEGAALARLAGGSIGRALDLADAGGLALHGQMIDLLRSLPRLDAVLAHRLADRLARPDAADAYETFIALLLDWLHRAVVAAAEGGVPAEAIEGEAALGARLLSGSRLDRWIDVWENLRTLFSQAESVNLDRKQVVLEAFFALEAAARGP